MLKGQPIEKRNSAWHKRHERRLMKTKARQKRGRIAAAPVSLSQAEAKYKEAQEREKQIKAPNIFLRLWLRFINLKTVAWLIGLKSRYQERQYRGTK